MGGSQTVPATRGASAARPPAGALRSSRAISSFRPAISFRASATTPRFSSRRRAASSDSSPVTSATTLARMSRRRALSPRSESFADSSRARRWFVSRTLAISVRTVSSGVSPSMPIAAAVSGESASPPTVGAMPTEAASSREQRTIPIMTTASTTTAMPALTSRFAFTATPPSRDRTVPGRRDRAVP